MPSKESLRAAVVQGLSRYRYILAVAVAVLLVLVLLPDDGNDKARRSSKEAASPSTLGTGGGSQSGEPTAENPQAPSTGAPGQGVTTASGPAGANAPSASRTGAGSSSAAGGKGGQAGSTSPSGAPRGGQAASALAPDCDPATGRIKVPTRYAPPCVPGAPDNGGATYQGVTKDSITVAVYINRLNPAAQALLRASGIEDSEENMKATYQAYVQYFEAHYQTWGRKVKLVFVTPSGADNDDAAAKADAIKVATEIKAFASWGGPIATTAYADELAARKILCICTISQPNEFYTDRAPYVISGLMSNTEGYIHRAEYVGKRLANRPAKFAGDPLLATKTRTFGLLYYETTEQSYRSGVLFFEKELAKYGVKLSDRLAFTGANNDPSATQEQARTLIARLKEKGVTSVIYAGDPLSPVFFTQEATRQRYNPEWILTGSAFTDTTFFARTYDQTQWAHAFGLSYLPARTPMALSDSYRVHEWEFGKPPAAKAMHPLLYSFPWIFYTGMHLGGPVVTPTSIRDGLFRFPPTGKGAITSLHISFGRHGIWPFDDYLANDDATEIFWDASANGPDETDRNGVGMYRYIAGGKRFLPGEHPKTDTRAFDNKDTVTLYTQHPASDRPPDYPRPKR
jgi:hypothetical protein